MAQRAQRLEDQGQYLEAAVLYQQLAARYEGQPKKQSIAETRMGEVLLRGDHAQEAFSAFEKAAEHDSSNTLAQLRLAQLYIAANSPQKSYDHLVAVLNQQPNQPEAVAALGAYYSAIGEVARAEKEFQRALEIEPQRQSTAVALADLYDNAGEVDKAREVLLRSAQAGKNDPLAWMALGRLEEEQGNGEAAENAYRNAVKADDSPETNLRLAQHLLRSAKIKDAEEALTRADSKKPLSSTWLADFELNAGQGVRASVHYQTVLQTRMAGAGKRSPDETAAIAARVIEADLGTASESPVRDRQNPAALARLHLDQYRSQLDPTTTHILEAEIALLDGDIAQAARAADDAVASGSDSAPAYFVRGQVRKAQGDDSDAVSQWTTALTKDPEYTPALLAMAEIDFAQKQYAAAEKQVAAVVRREPANLNALLLYARVLSANEDSLAARAIVARAKAVARNASEPYVVLGQIEMKQHRPALALIEFQQAVILDPQSREALEGLTAVYREGKMTHELIARLEHTAAAPPRSSALMEIAGRLYSDHHEYNDAERCFTKALEIDRQRATAAMALAENAMAHNKGQAFDTLQSLAGKLGGSADALLAALRAQEQNQPEQAIANYETAIQRGEATGVAANNLAWLYAEKGQSLDRALELARFAHDHDPKNLAVTDTLGFVYLARREYTQAVNVLKDAVQSASASHAMPDAQTQTLLRQHLAEAYARAGAKEAMSN
jgi:tetratricopeptide (TPR) repeat protein